MKPRRPDPKATQPSEVAIVTLGWGRKSSSSAWYYYSRLCCSHPSQGYKDRDTAVKAALSNGFGAVEFEGRVIAKKS